MNKNRNHIILLSAFLVGFAFLIFEINLFRALSNLFGATVVATTLTLSVFMGGYGVGSLLIGNRATFQKRLSKFYGITIFSIGIFGIISYLLINYGLTILYPTLHQINLNPFLINIIVYFLAIILLFLPSFLFGGVLPLATKLVTTEKKEIPKNIGYIYAVDTIGSALGGILTGFVLNRYLGQLESVIIASTILMTIGMVILRTIKDNDLDFDTKKRLNKTQRSPWINKNVLFAALIFGFGMNGLQTLFIRVFKTYLVNAVYSFSIITSLVIFGFFIGSWVYKTKTKTKTYTINNLINILLIFGTLALGSLFLIEQIPGLIMFPLGELFNNQIFRVIGIPIFVTIITILPLSILSGFAFPMTCSLTANNTETISNDIGKTVLFNTLGSVLGPIIIGFVLIPLIGISHSMVSISAILTIFTILLITLYWNKFQLRKQLLYASIVLIFLSILVGYQYKVRILPPSFIKSNRHIKAYKENMEGTYVVGEEISNGNRILTTFVNNSAVIGTSYDAIKVVKMVGHLPFLMGLECKNALVVGFGIGVTTAAIGTHASVEHIDCIELVSNLTDVAHFYNDINNNIHKDSRVKLIEDDGRHFLQTTNNKYDLISSDPTHPILGSGSLYTKEYFELCRNRLTEHGMVSQYLPLHKLQLADLMGIIKTFNSVFPNSSVWIGHFHAVLIGSIQSQTIDFKTWTDNMERSSADKLFYNNPYHIASSLLFDSQQTAKITSNYRINYDNVAYTDYFAFESLKEENIATNLQFLHEHRNGHYRQFTNITNPEIMERFIKGNKYLTQGLIEMQQNNWEGLFSNIEKACMVNPENVEYPLLLEFYKRADKSKTH